MLFNFFLSHNKKSAHTCTRGFGLVELMVSISIMTLVSTVILVKNRSFNNALLLRNQAYEVAFALRQAQLLAVSGNEEKLGDSNQYGIYFNTSDGSKYQTFRDDYNTPVTRKGWYNSGSPGDTTIGPIGTLDSRFSISSITYGAGITTNALAVTFVRPNFDALFKAGSAPPASVSGPVQLRITPKDTSGYTTVPYRIVEITSTGQITVK